MPKACGCDDWAPGYPWAYPYYAVPYPYYAAPGYYNPYGYWPGPWAPPAPDKPAHHHHHHEDCLPQELLADEASPKQAFIGGEDEVHLILEYMPDGTDPAPSVAVSLTVDGTTTDWKEDPVATGYHVKRDFRALPPGATIKVTVKGAYARLRWCELVKY